MVELEVWQACELAVKRIACQVFAAVLKHAHIIFNTDATIRPQPVEFFLVDKRITWRTCKVVNQHIDNIKTRFNREHLVCLE